MRPTPDGTVIDQSIKEAIRIAVDKAIERYIPLLRVDKTRLTVRECMYRYRRSREFLVSLIRRGELEASYLPQGKNGRPQYLIVTDSAERHPLLGGMK